MSKRLTLIILYTIAEMVFVRTEVPDIRKITMTQKGYIQFLKYKVDVPPLQQFTFCLWIKSQNLTHSHPILSYSKHERDRYIRSGLTEGGNGIKFIIMEQLVADLPIRIRTNLWYHVCQSWDSNTGRWQIYLNGQLKGQGVSKKLRGAIIPGGGEMVLGQEYTDFDKGLDDGVEGELFGFNMILSSTTEEPNHRYYHRYESNGVINQEAKSKESDGYIRIDNLSQETLIKPSGNDSKLNTEHTAQSTKINSETKSKLRFVTDNYYNIDVDYTTFSPQDFKNSVLKNITSDIPYSGDDEYEDDLLRPPVNTLHIPFWSLVNDAGREGKFKSGEFQTLALTHLPVYETPPNLPIYDESKKSTPSFEVTYSKTNFKGNQWYDQNEYFPKELLQRNKPKGAKHYTSRRNKQRIRSQNAKVKDLYPYPSEYRFEYVKSPIEHAIFRRDANYEKNVEILNPDSIIIYPGKSGIINVELHPRDEDQESAKIDQLKNVDIFEQYRVEDQGRESQNVNVQDSSESYESAYAKLHYTGSLVPKQLNERARNPYKQYPHSISDKINEANYDRYGSADFEKSIKLGNALGEIRIFKQHGEDRVRSFEGSDGVVPDVNRYRSDIDNVRDDKGSIYVFDDVNVNNHEAFHKLNRNKETDVQLARQPKSAGRKLVELSYRKCLLDRGSPLAKDSATLISWTMTPMKLYGGSLLKKANPSCGNF